MSAIAQGDSGSAPGIDATLWRDPWTRAAFAVALLYVLEMLLQGGGPLFVRRFAVFADLPTGFGASIASAFAARCCAPRSPMRRAWALLAVAQLAFVLGSAAWAWLQEVRGEQPFPSPADAFYIAFYVIAFAAVVAFSAAVPMRVRRLAFALDGAIFVAAAAALAWALAIVPFLERPGADFTKGTMSIAYACGSALLVFGMGTLLVRGGIVGRQRPLRTLAFAFAVLFAADLAWLSAELDGRFKPGGWPDALYVISQAIQIAAARLHCLAPERGEPAPGRDGVSAHSTGLVSLFTMLATGSLVLWLRRAHISRDEGVVLVAMIVAAALAGVRQSVSARELARIRARVMRQDTERRFAAIFEHSSDVVVVTDRDGVIQHATQAIAHVLGHAPHAVVGMRAADFLHADQAVAGNDFFRDALRSRAVAGPGEWRLRTRGGGFRDVEAVATNLLDDPAIAGVVITLRDVTERRLLEDRLSELAFTDSLTRLGNRGRFRDAVVRALEAQRVADTPCAILFVDLDDFKRVNDSLGHQRGDELLRLVAERLRAKLPEQAEVARLGGDEFAVLLRDCPLAHARGIAEEVIATIAEPLHIGAATLTIGASVGIALSSAGSAADDVLRHADIAMYEAKRGGKARAASFEQPMQVRASQRLDLEGRLREAIAAGRIGVWYQPVMDMRSGEITSIEALARWDDAVLGAIPAGEFIALAEDSGQIGALGHHVLRTACSDVAGWRASRPGLQRFSVAVNVSARQFDGDGFPALVDAALLESGLDATSLVLELTESVMLHPAPSLRAALDRLRRGGIRLALDDFGAGYSSLTYLHRFEFDVLKIDRALVERVGYTVDGTALVRAVLSVAEALHLAVVAEGVEDHVQQDELVRLGCRLGQGFLLARPMPGAAFLEWLAARTAVANPEPQ